MSAEEPKPESFVMSDLWTGLWKTWWGSIPPTSQPLIPWPTPAQTAFGAWQEYWTDAWQRSVLYWDVMRKRGNLFLEHEEQGKPPVLSFPYEMVVDGRTLDHPVNYFLLRIVPGEDTPVDPRKRPFVVIDPRAGHGGPDYTAPVVVNDKLLADLDRYVLLAPLHQPNNLRPIRAIQQSFPEMLQVACFDTAFHRGHPEVADRYALPESFYQEGVRRYGFHGLSYEYIARTLPSVAPELAGGKVVVAHLGSGASMCALVAGRSVESTMGFSALDGLPMGTRCGQIDPGVLLYMMVEKGYEAREIERLLYHDCGLKGLSGISNDVRDLLASEDPRATLALDYFVYRIGRELGSLAAAMGGIDALALTAGISENSAVLRARIYERASWLGIGLDEDANQAGGPRLSTADSPVSAWMIPTNEERVIAEHTLAVLRSQ